MCSEKIFLKVKEWERDGITLLRREKENLETKLNPVGSVEATRVSGF
jgi:hypothetical protein